MPTKPYTHFNLHLKLDQHKPLSREREERWQDMITLTDNNIASTALIFFAELLELLDPKAGPCTFTCENFYGPDSMSNRNQKWELSTGNISLRREIVEGMSESWQSIETETDIIEVSGLNRIELQWDGNLRSGTTFDSITLTNLDEDEEAAILNCAGSLYAVVNNCRTDTDKALKKLQKIRPRDPGTPAWSEFTESFFDNKKDSWYSRLNTNALRKLEGNELKLAQKILLTSADDSSIIGIRELMLVDGIPKLEKIFRTGTGIRKIMAAHGLILIKELCDGDSDYSEALDEIIRTHPDVTTRATAINRLVPVRTERTREVMFSSIEDPDYIVRYLASNALMKFHGLEGNITRFEEIYKLIQTESTLEITDAEKQNFASAGRKLKELLGPYSPPMPPGGGL